MSMDNQQNTPQSSLIDQYPNPEQSQQTPPKNKKKAIIIISLVVVSVLAAFGGLYYWQNSKNQDLQKQLDASKAEVMKLQQSSTEATTETSVPATTTTPATSDAGYLVIPEYGVKVKLSDADKVTYIITGTPGGSGNTAGVQSYATINLKNNTQGSKCATVGLSLTQRTSGGTKVGTSYYGFDGGEPQACGNAQEDALRTKIYNELVNAQIVAKE